MIDRSRSLYLWGPQQGLQVLLYLRHLSGRYTHARYAPQTRIVTSRMFEFCVQLNVLV